jgi:hypothetical protein
MMAIAAAAGLFANYVPIALAITAVRLDTNHAANNRIQKQVGPQGWWIQTKLRSQIERGEATN